MITSSPIARGARRLTAPGSAGFEARNTVKNVARRMQVVAAILSALACAPGVALAAGVVETDLVANQQTLTDANGVVHRAKFVDPNLVNPWGVGTSATSPFWVADNGAGLSTLYDTQGTPQTRVVSIPAPGDPLGTGGAPTGLVFNIAASQNAFMISGVNTAGTATAAPALFSSPPRTGRSLAGTLQ